MLVGVLTIRRIWPNWPDPLEMSRTGWSKFGVVQNVKELNTQPELSALPVRDRGVLHHGEIRVEVSRTKELVAGLVAKTKDGSVGGGSGRLDDGRKVRCVQTWSFGAAIGGRRGSNTAASLSRTVVAGEQSLGVPVAGSGQNVVDRRAVSDAVGEAAPGKHGTGEPPALHERPWSEAKRHFVDVAQAEVLPSSPYRYSLR